VFGSLESRLCQSCVDLERRAGAHGESAHGRDATSGNEDGAHETGICRRREQAAAGSAQLVDPAEGARDAVERFDAVA